MSDCKRCAQTQTIEAIGEASSNGPTISKKRKTTASDMLHHYSLPHFPDVTFSPVTSVNSAGTVVSEEFCLDRSPLSSCSSSYVIQTGKAVKKLDDSTRLDLKLQSKGLKNVDSRNRNFKSFSLLNEFCGDSEETMVFPANTPPEEEIEEFFATAERQEQKQFAEKYNFDIVRDMPLEGRYQWVRLH